MSAHAYVLGSQLRLRAEVDVHIGRRLNIQMSDLVHVDIDFFVSAARTMPLYIRYGVDMEFQRLARSDRCFHHEGLAPSHSGADPGIPSRSLAARPDSIVWEELTSTGCMPRSRTISPAMRYICSILLWVRDFLYARCRVKKSLTRTGAVVDSLLGEVAESGFGRPLSRVQFKQS